MIDPIAFNLLTIEIRWYGILYAIGLIGGYFIWKKLSKEEGLNEKTILELYLFMLFWLFIGSRLFHILLYNFDYFYNNPTQVFNFFGGGLSSHGGIIGGTLGGYYYCWKRKLDFWKLADVAIIGIAFPAGCIRVGNFLNNELVGRITDVPWAIKFKGYNDYRHPSQLYEAAKNFFITILLYKLHYIKSLRLPKGFLYWLFIFLFSILRIVTENFKEYMVFETGLTMGQRISIIFSIISGIILIWLWVKKRD